MFGSPERTGGGTAASADATITVGEGCVIGAGAAAWLGGVQSGGGTKALLGLPEDIGAVATVTACGAGGGATTGSGALATVVVGTKAGAGVTDSGGVVGACPGGVQPGGGMNALLGSEGTAGAAAEITGAVTGAAAIVVTTGAGGGAVDVGTGAADATTGSMVRPGGAQPTGGTNALFGSPWGIGTATGSGVAADAAAAAAGAITAVGSATGALEIGATAAGAGDSAALAVRPLEGGSAGALLFASLSAAARAGRCSRALASRSIASFSAASFCAFWPPRPATMEPTCGPVRVSSTGAMPESYWRPVLAEGRLAPAATWASAPGRAFALGTGALLPNIPQPDRIANADTPTKPNHRPRPPIMSCSRCIVVTCLKPGSHTVSSGSREEI